jgi:hypothetical protein
MEKYIASYMLRLILKKNIIEKINIIRCYLYITYYLMGKYNIVDSIIQTNKY